MQTSVTVRASLRTAPATSVQRNAPNKQVKALARRELLASGAAIAAAVCGTGAAKAAGESSATRAITAVTRPQQLQKKNENRAALKEQVEKVKAGEADPKSLP